jgi:hypothetical protein
MIMPYFGQFPEWINIYFETCRWNDSIDYIFFTDADPPDGELPPNVSIVPLTLSAFNQLYRSRLPDRRPIEKPYKICDIRPAYGIIFHEYIKACPFFGWGDIDVIYGDVAGYLTPDMLSADVISFNSRHVSGHLTIARTSCAHVLPAGFPNWSDRVDSPDYQHLDEPRGLDGLTLSAADSFNTPLSPITPWTNGEFIFPNEWYWRAGSLTNDLDGNRTFPYLHFMHWKGGEWPRTCGNGQWENLPSVVNLRRDQIASGFRVNSQGFFPIEREDPSCG